MSMEIYACTNANALKHINVRIYVYAVRETAARTRKNIG